MTPFDVAAFFTAIKLGFQLLVKYAPLIMMIAEEIFRKKREARLKNEQFILDQQNLLAIVDQSFDRMLSESGEDTQAAHSVETTMDNDEW